jgi:hypothetical protein
MNAAAQTMTLPKWFWICAGLGLAWNMFGVVQFMGTAMASQEGLMMGGMTRAQADLYFDLPVWMNIAFAIGVFGGLLGSAMLLLRRKQAVPVLAVSLAAYIVLYIGDITEGVFAIMGSEQVIILTSVVLIAVGLLWLARKFERQSALY